MRSPVHMHVPSSCTIPLSSLPSPYHLRSGHSRPSRGMTESVFVTLYDWNRFFPVCAALWLFLLCWRRTAHLLAIQAMGMIALLVLYGLVLSAVGGIQDYTRLQVPFRPLLILIICGSLLLG